VQRTLAISMAILVLLVGLIIGSIMRAVMQPVRLAAQTSRLLAAGQLEERIPEKGEDDIGTLARSFNHMADNLQHQIEQLENLSKVQQRFVSDVSHELRTPLTTIRLAGGLVYSRKDDFDPTLSRAAELLHDQVERFELLLADLLEISRYDAGAVELLRKEHDLKEVAEDVIAAMLPVAIEHGEALVLRAPDRGVIAEFDDRRINRIVRNLVANAIEHGEGKPIVVTVDANATAVSLTVRDYGIGMSEEQQTNVFDRFWRADPSRKRTMGGSGLGMAIAKDDAHLHSGLLEVWSAPQLGSNFRLTLPRHHDEPIVTSPLPLLPDDAGADTYTREHQGEKVEGFSNEDLSTQPITLRVALPGLGQEFDAEPGDDNSGEERR
jgi:two-component system sensor histidine kinase MtrB